MACDDLILDDKCPVLSNAISVSFSQVKFYKTPASTSQLVLILFIIHSSLDFHNL